MKFESKNPFLKNKSFSDAQVTADTSQNGIVIDYNNVMTVSGTMNKTFIMFLLLICGAALTWWMTSQEINTTVMMVGGAIVSLIMVLVASFRPNLAPWLAPGYAIFQGLFIGGISAFFEIAYPGIVIQAVGATMVTALVCLALYKFEIVKVTQQFRSVVVAATLAILTFYIISWLITLFVPSFVPAHSGNSLMSIGITVFVIIVAALNLFLDFDSIEQGARQQMPKYMEWFGAMGLTVTLVWLYVEFLRLLSKLASRD